MAATERETLNVYKWLQDTHYVSVNNDWLEACICWLKEQNGQENYNQSSLQRQVWEQWLLSDLSESGVSCLPLNITNTPKGIINGSLPLQMNLIINVGESAYSQWKKLKGEETSAAEPNSTQYRQQQSPSRMFKMELTDGELTVEAIEYKHISLLNTALSPGTKILIKGGPSYRSGIIFLEQNNIQILGGQVESLLEENSQISILHRLAMKNAGPDQLLQNARNGPPGNDGDTETQTRTGGIPRTGGVTGTGETLRTVGLSGTRGISRTGGTYGGENNENNAINDDELAQFLDSNPSYLAELDQVLYEDENKDNNEINDYDLAEYFDEDASYLENLDFEVRQDQRMNVDIFDEMTDDIPDDVLNDLMEGGF